MGVLQHGAERRGEGQGEAGVNAVGQPAVHDLDQGHVGLGDGLKKPVLLEKFLVLRVAHKRQVRVQQEGKVALHRDQSKSLVNRLAMSSLFQ